MRHASSGAPYFVAERTGAAVINAGDGWHAHPTQGLLDAYTLRAALGDLAGKRVVIVGDVLHSRVARSDINTLVPLGAEITLSGPRTRTGRGPWSRSRSRTASRCGWPSSTCSWARPHWRSHEQEGFRGSRSPGEPRLHRSPRSSARAGLRGVGDRRERRAGGAARRV